MLISWFILTFEKVENKSLETFQKKKKRKLVSVRTVGERFHCHTPTLRMIVYTFPNHPHPPDCTISWGKGLCAIYFAAKNSS